MDSGGINMYTLDELKSIVKGCRRCPLYRTRTNTVFGEAVPMLRLFIKKDLDITRMDG